jgi:hypothetical protein
VSEVRTGERRAFAVAALAGALLVAALLAVALLAVTVAGCGSGSGGSATGAPSASATSHWTKVLTRQISGARPVKLNLGVYGLGPGGVGYGSPVSSGDEKFALDDPAAVVLAPIWAGKYIVYFSQRFPAAKGPGYDAEITVWTIPQ